MEIKILAFGPIKEITRWEEHLFQNILETDSLLKKLIDLFPDLEKFTFQMAVNSDIITQKTYLKNGDEIALLPPFSGG